MVQGIPLLYYRVHPLNDRSLVMLISMLLDSFYPKPFRNGLASLDPLLRNNHGDSSGNAEYGLFKTSFNFLKTSIEQFKLKSQII